MPTQFKLLCSNDPVNNIYMLETCVLSCQLLLVPVPNENNRLLANPSFKRCNENKPHGEVNVGERLMKA